ncbi:hypothetical protein [Pedobacter steynii]|uniref:Uncharacterized protein n=1 Tax=Pedobacter steynii TaxID=430522 RepID=A0A1D7QN40_9SPHI|nr:hypothetical protein [Pedobacter steynii]AOM80080.1 hypothetical protein BFS30_24705 [Pedobacter steynii]
MKVKDINELGAYLEHLGLADAAIMENLQTLKEGEGFIGRVAARHGEDRLSCRYQISRDSDSNLYRLDGYNAALLRVDIPHGVLDGISSMNLEARLKEVDVYRDWQDVFDRHSSIAQICMELTLLSKSTDEEARELGNLLSLKYLADTPVEKLVEINIDRHHYEKEIFIPLMGNDHDTGILQAYNLLCGRGIMKLKDISEDHPPEAYWLVLENGYLQSLPEFDIVGQLMRLPFNTGLDREVVQDMFLQLVNGDQITVDLSMAGQRRQGIIEVDARQGMIVLCNQQGERILTSAMIRRELPNLNNREKPNGAIKNNAPIKKKKGPSL